MEEIEDIELVLVGPNLQHAWFTHKCTSKAIEEVTIEYHRNLFDEKFLRRNQLSFIRTMFEKSVRGILFSRETSQQLAPRIMELNQQHGFDSVLELMSILHDSASAATSASSPTPLSTIRKNIPATAAASKALSNT